MQGPRLRDEWDSALLLVVLYMIQGVPLGLSMGSMWVPQMLLAVLPPTLLLDGPR